MSRPAASKRASLMVRAADATASKDEEEESKVGVYGGPTRLKEGLRRQTMLIYVADETGMINRVAGVFARRGYNIESLAVGLNVDKAIFTVVVIATDSDVDKLIKQINKLAKVRRVELVTDKMCVERGLMLIKVRAEPEQRPEIIELGKVFRASVVDTSSHSLTFATTGDPGKNRAFQQACLKFGIVQVARTGKLALKREPVFSEARRRRVRLMHAARGDEGGAIRRLRFGPRRGVRARWPIKSSASCPRWTPRRITASTWATRTPRWTAARGEACGTCLFSRRRTALRRRVGGAGSLEDIPKMDPNAKYTHTISIVVMNKPGVLDVVTGVFARRGYNAVAGRGSGEDV